MSENSEAYNSYGVGYKTGYKKGYKDGYKNGFDEACDKCNMQDEFNIHKKDWEDMSSDFDTRTLGDYLTYVYSDDTQEDDICVECNNEANPWCTGGCHYRG